MGVMAHTQSYRESFPVCFHLIKIEVSVGGVVSR